jgi:aspartyl-tRNA(Asn)/glutamyl-tRNA(Gln) amidotransferase subunit A
VDGACWSIDTIGPISRTASDCAATIGAIAGYDPKDPYTRQILVPDYRQALIGDIKGLRVGLVRELLDYEQLGLDPQTRDAVVAAAEVLSELGAQVTDISLPLAKHAGAIIRTITHTERVSLHPEWLRAIVRQQVLEALNEVDVLVQPTSSSPATKMGLSSGVRSVEQVKKALVEGSFRGVYSLAGVPALSILCGFTSPDEGGLPLAMQIAGRPFEEATVLRVAHAYEQNNPWHTRRPLI